MPSLRACDCCSRRKVRCDRQKPCQNCQKSDLLCSYASKPKKRGPKGPTKIIQELRLLQQAQQQTTSTSTAASQDDASAGGFNMMMSETDTARYAADRHYHHNNTTSAEYDVETNTPSPASTSRSHSSTSPIASPGGGCSGGGGGGFTYQRPGASYFPDPTTGALVHPNPIFKPHRLVTHAFAANCAAIFFQNLYPIMPIFDRASFHEAYIRRCHSEPQVYALVTAMCALTLIQLCAVSDGGAGGGGGAEPPESTSTSNNSPWESSAAAARLGISSEYELERLSKTLLSEALRARRFFEYIAAPSLDTVITSFFLFCCYGNLESNAHAWYYLRESIGFAQGIGLDEEKTYWRARQQQQQQQMQAGAREGRGAGAGAGALSDGERWRRMFWLLFITER